MPLAARTAEVMERKLAAILAADVAGYSRLMGVDEEGTLNALRAHREVVDGLIAAHRGRVFNSAGDSVVAEFPSAVEAINSAVEIQQEMGERNEPVAKDKRLEFRIGLNIGDVMAEGGNLFGDGVNVAARVQELAEPGGICVARNVHDQVRHKVGVAFESLGQHQVKNIAEPVSVYRVLIEGTAATPRLVRWLHAMRRHRWTAAALAVILMAAAGSVAAWYLRPHETPAGALPTVAVLPFENLSGDPEQEYFSDGITEDIIAALTRFPGLRVLGRNTTFAHKGQVIDVQELGPRLGARYFLEGSVRRAGDRIRVSVQLVEAASAQPTWAERYDRNASDLFAIQDDVTQRVVGTLISQISRTEVQRLLRSPPRSLQAYELTLKGRAAWLQSTPESILEARRLLEQAIAIDPGYVPAYVYAAFTYLTSYNNRWNEEFGQRRTIEQMAAKASSAIRLDGSYALGHATYAVALAYLGEHAGARAEAEQAIALNPNDPDVLGRVGQTLVFAGEHERAIETVTRAIELDPFTPAQWLNFLSRAHYFLGHDETAAQIAKACIAKAPLRPCFETEAAAFGQLGKVAEAQAALAELRALTPDATATAAVGRLRHVFLKQEDLDRLVDGLRKAGLPEK